MAKITRIWEDPGTGCAHFIIDDAAFDPTVTGLQAPTGSEATRVDGKLYVKTGSAATAWSDITASAGGGEVNTGANINVDGIGVFDGKVGVQLQFRGIKSEDAAILVTHDATNKTIDFTLDETVIPLDNLSGTLGVAKGGTGGNKSNIAQGRFFASPLSGSGAMTDRTIGPDDIGLTTDGDLISRESSALQRIPKLAAGNYLRRKADDTGYEGGTPASGGYTPPWVVTGAGRFYAAIGDGEISDYVHPALSMTSQVGPTPTNVGTAVVRLVRFRLPKQLTVASIRIFYTAAAVNVFSFAVYRASDLVRMFNTGLLTSPGANAWGNFAISGSPVLAADTEYYLAMGVSATGTTACFRSFPQMVNGAVFGATAAPLGNLLIGMPAFFQTAITIGATPTWPNPIVTAIAAAAYVNGTTGTIPLVLLEGTAA